MYESSWFLKILSAASLANKEKNISLAIGGTWETRTHLKLCPLTLFVYLFLDNLQLILSGDCGASWLNNGNMIIYKKKKIHRIIELPPFRNENISFSAHTKIGWTCNEFQMNFTSCCIRLVIPRCMSMTNDCVLIGS